MTLRIKRAFTPSYNLPICVLDTVTGLGDFTNLIVYLNTSSARLVELSFQTDADIVELSSTDMMTISPPLFIPVSPF